MGKAQITTPPSFDTVWAILQENAQQLKALKESQRETDRQIKETSQQIKETDLQMKETRKQMKETDRQMKETDQQVKRTSEQIKISDKKFGELNNRFGDIVEYMIAPNLRTKFRELGLIFPKANNKTKVDDDENDIHLEIDVMLENGNKAMLVEVKTTLTTEKVKEHVLRLEKMRKYADLHNDKRSFLGAVAGVVMTPNVKKYALKQGFFAIEPSGETFKITPPQGQPKEW